MTNFERIKAMNFEEMWRFLIDWNDGDIDWGGFCDICDQDHCNDCVRYWLESEVSE